MLGAGYNLQIERLYKLAGLDSILNACTRLDTRLHPGLNPEVGNSLEYKCSVTRVATNMAWYSPCVRYSMGGVSAMSGGVNT